MKADKWEKGEIIKQLVALSEGDNSVSAKTSLASSRRACLSVSRSDAKLRSKRTLTETATEIEEKIRQRAYELYQKRGGTGGDPTDDWLQARREVLSQKA